MLIGSSAICSEIRKKVYLDKPISVTLDDAHAITEAETKMGNRLLMGFTRRYEAWIKMKELLDGGAVGSLQMILLRSIIPYSGTYKAGIAKSSGPAGL